MKASRELDALIAEKVMGLIFDKETDAFHDGYIGIRVDEFKPSTNIADAWLVVEKLKEMGFGVDIYDQKGFGVKVELYYNTFSVEHPGFNSGEHFGWKETAPLAICLAALKARGVEVDG